MKVPLLREMAKQARETEKTIITAKPLSPAADLQRRLGYSHPAIARAQGGRKEIVEPFLNLNNLTHSCPGFGTQKKRFLDFVFLATFAPSR